jgi:hypothetical protein
VSTPWKPRGRFGFAFTVAAALGALLASACAVGEDVGATSDTLTTQPSSTVLFSPSTKRVVVEVDYASGAEPFVDGDSPTFKDPWSIAEQNLRALMGDDRELVLPRTLSEMQRVDGLPKGLVGERELVAAAKQHRTAVSFGDTVTFYVVFLDAVFAEEDGTPRPQVPGVTVRGAGIVGMFKPAVAYGFLDPAKPTFMEQATLVHELGHALGLVDRGVPLTSRHKDERNGAHCRNPACIMFHQNVLVRDDVDFYDSYLLPRDGILFGSECLADVRAIARTPR